MEEPQETITFLFTDLEGSTRLWEEFPDAMRAALARHDALLHACIEENRGRVVKGTGDGMLAIFAEAADGVSAAQAAQAALLAQSWETPTPLRVRMALHTGSAEERDGDYYGAAVNRAARLMAIGHGGQVLLSQPVGERAREGLPEGCHLREMGRHALKDLQQPEVVFQLQHPDLPTDFPPLKSLDNLPNNLPRQLTLFIGRERETEEVKRLLETAPLVTLTGSGGCGKTRLGLQAAADVLDLYPDGVWFVELAPLTDGERVPRTVAAALSLREEPGRTALQTLTEYARTRALLLVLDNCEHLISACAQLADALLQSCPRVRLLATSREALQVAGERTYRIPSLSLPDPKERTRGESLAQYEAVRLFVERARQVRPDYRLHAEEGNVVLRICRRVDGIPLALELAAARMRAMTAEQIAERLDDRFRLLAGGSRSAPPRHQTLRATLDWSYDLLSEAERLLLRRLAIFVGGWSLEAAERVCAGESEDRVEPWEVLDLLTSLVDKSLVVFEEAAGEGRYRLLETVRQYGQERLSETGEWSALRARHLGHFLSLAEEAEPHLRGTDQATWLARLEIEHDNLRVALERVLRVPDEPAKAYAAEALRLCGALGWFWLVHCHYGEGRALCADALSSGGTPAPPKIRADVLLASARLAQQQGDYTAAQTLYAESLALYRELGDRRGIAVCTGNLGNLAYDRGDHDARALYDECLALSRELGDSRSIALSLNNLGIIAVGKREYEIAESLFSESLALHREKGNSKGVALALGNLGDVAKERKDFTAAHRFFEESLAISRELGDSQEIALALGNLGRTASYEGNLATALTLHAESLTIYRDIGKPSGIASALEGFADTLGREGHAVFAARLLGAAERIREDIGSPLSADAREDYQRIVSTVRESLGEAAFTFNWDAGRSLTWEAAVQEALSGRIERLTENKA